MSSVSGASSQIEVGIWFVWKDDGAALWKNRGSKWLGVAEVFEPETPEVGEDGDTPGGDGCGMGAGVGTGEGEGLGVGSWDEE